MSQAFLRNYPPAHLRTVSQGHASAQARRRDSMPAAPSVWLVNPVVDLLFCCGGLVWIFFALHTASSHPSSPPIGLQILALISLAGVHGLSEPHVAATLARVYRTPESTQKFAPYTTWLALGFAILAIFGLLVPGLTPLLSKIYLLLVAQHFTGQTYGIALLYCYRAGYKVTALERKLLWLLMNGTALFAVLRQLTYWQFSGNGFLAQRIPFWGPLPEWIFHSWTVVLAMVAVAFAAILMRRAFVEKVAFPLPAALTILTGVAIYTVNRQTTEILFVYAPAFYHGSQYLILTIGYYLKENPTQQVKSQLFRHGMLLLMGALFIYVAVPQVLKEFGVDYTLAFATIFCVVNLHHFMTDQAIWKLRDPKTRAILLS